MITIGLTGSIGMGKSMAAAMFQDYGVPVFDSDKCVRRLLSADEKAIREVVAHFPDCWDLKKREIDRRILADIVFRDPEEKERLETILHPYVWTAQEKFSREMQRLRKQAIVLDIPLLFETGAEYRVDTTVVVTAPPYIQYQRVMSRPDMTEEKFFSILEGQMPDEDKRRLADFVVPTGIGFAETRKHIIRILHDLVYQEVGPANNEFSDPKQSV